MNNKKQKTKLIKRINGITKFDNSFLNGAFADFSAGWTSFDLDWWNVIGSQVVNQGDTIIKIPFDQVKELFVSSRRHLSYAEFAKLSNDTFDKFLKITVRNRKDLPHSHLEMSNLNIFNLSYISTADNTFVLQVNKFAVPYFNDLVHWTRFALVQFTALISKYAKRLFMYLKQWRTVGYHTFTMKEFRKKIDVPKSYDPSNIDERVIEPALEELAPYFKQIEYKKNYGKGKRGRKVIGYTFSWIPENRNQKDIYGSKILMESTAMYYIMNNKQLKFSQKCLAIDKYRKLRRGSTLKFYKKHHPNTYFIESDQRKRAKRPITNRADLNAINSYTTDTLFGLAKLYEHLNEGGQLKAGDQDDLTKIELNLFEKYFALTNKDKRKSIENKTIAGFIFNKKDIKHNPVYDATSIEKDIKYIIRDDYAKKIQGQDHRSLDKKLVD